MTDQSPITAESDAMMLNERSEPSRIRPWNKSQQNRRNALITAIAVEDITNSVFRATRFEENPKKAESIWRIGIWKEDICPLSEDRR